MELIYDLHQCLNQLDEVKHLMTWIAVLAFGFGGTVGSIIGGFLGYQLAHIEHDEEDD